MSTSQRAHFHSACKPLGDVGDKWPHTKRKTYLVLSVPLTTKCKLLAMNDLDYKWMNACLLLL